MPEPRVPITFEVLARKTEFLEKRVGELEARARDADALRTREREEQRREYTAMLDGAKRTIEDAISTSEPLTQMKELLALNKGQMAILEEARDERVRRSERDKISADKKADDELAAKLRRTKLEDYLKILAAVTATAVTLAAVLPKCPSPMPRPVPTGEPAR